MQGDCLTPGGSEVSLLFDGIKKEKKDVWQQPSTAFKKEVTRSIRPLALFTSKFFKFLKILLCVNCKQLISPSTSIFLNDFHFKKRTENID